MTSPVPPVWDGEGKDPWLPHRLVALLNAQKAEDSIYAVVWEALSSWLVTTTRRVMAGPTIQPEEILASVPAWERRITQIIVEGLMPVMSWAYEGLFGPDFMWEGRPNTLAYFAGVRNRLVRTPDEVFTLVSGQLAAGVTLGEGIPELSERVDHVLSLTDTPRWRNRAVVIARTETGGALQSSRFDAFQAFNEEGDEELERMWLSTTGDGRTRPSHREADGQRVPVGDPFMVGGFPLMYPGDPAGPANEVIQCRCDQLLLEVGETVDLSNRQFRG